MRIVKVRMKNCLECGVFFKKMSTESVAAWENRHKYCTRRCMMLYRQKHDPSVLETRFKVGDKALNPIKKGQRFSPKTEFKKGVVPWITGKKHPNTWNKRKQVSAISGENHWNWKGGVTPLKRKIRDCVEYKLWKDQVYQRDSNTCVLCGETQKLCVDHIKPFSEILRANEIETLEDALLCKELFDVSNGRVLCNTCHANTDTYFAKQHLRLSQNNMYGSKKGKGGCSPKGGKGKKGR